MTRKQYNALAEKYSPEELAESFVFPDTHTKTQRAQDDALLKEALKHRRAAISPELQLEATLL